MTTVRRLATICIIRRPMLQDLFRRYTVFIDDNPVGKIAAFKKGSYPVPSGEHSVQLRMANTGRSSSAVIPVRIGPDETQMLRTKSLGLKDLALVPLAIFNPDRFAPRPWIQLEVQS